MDLQQEMEGLQRTPQHLDQLVRQRKAACLRQRAARTQEQLGHAQGRSGGKEKELGRVPQKVVGDRAHSEQQDYAEVPEDQQRVRPNIMITQFYLYNSL